MRDRVDPDCARGGPQIARGKMKILVPIDHSTFSEAAVATVASLVRPKGNQVHVLHVIEHESVYLSVGLVPHLVNETPRMKIDEKADARALVDRAAAKLRRAGFAAKGVVVETGNAKSVILDYAKEWGAGLIVVGSHGLKGLGRVLMGSVSDAVVRNAACSVQVVRMPASRPKAGKQSRTRR
jgi:nucleotide-binding universal stress UspA family protein